MSEKTHILKSFLVELLVYSGLVLAYFFLVLHFLGDWLHGWFVRDIRIYAAIALGLMLGQGVLLEVITSALLRFIRSRTEE